MELFVIIARQDRNDWIDEIARKVYKTKCLSTGTGSYKTLRQILRFFQYSVLIKQE